MASLSYLSDCTEKRVSKLHGRGLFARVPIVRGETIAVRGGYVMTQDEWAKIEPAVGLAAEIHIADGLVLAPANAEQCEGTMMHLNHSCSPNVGVEGQIVFVAMRDIAADEELAIDYAMMDDWDGEMECSCATAQCRRVVRGQDWRIRELQRRYAGYFSAYLAKRIAQNETSR